MQHFRTILAGGVAMSIGATPAPAQTNDVELILRLLNGLFAQGQAAPGRELRGRSWNDDDDDGYRRGWNDDDDDGYRRGRDDDDDDGGWNDDDD